MAAMANRLTADIVSYKPLPCDISTLSPQQEACCAYGSQDADALFQEIAREAQLCVGIPYNKIFPIKKVAPTSENHDILAFSSNGILFINQDLLERKKTDINHSIGQLRMVIFHEAMHVKQYRKNGNISAIQSCYCSSEKEADLQAALLANCWRCTTQYAENAKDENDNSPAAQYSRAQGYASKQELMTIAEQQKLRNACCVYHNRM